jgi:hypothetical protein
MPRRVQPIIQPFPEDIDRDAFGHYLSGFADGEACFHLQAFSSSSKAAYATFGIRLRSDDSEVLHLIQSFWRCGRLRSWSCKSTISPNSSPCCDYRISRANDLFAIVIPHFERYPLRAKKRKDFFIWAKGVRLLHAIQSNPRKGQPRGLKFRWPQESIAEFNLLAAALKDGRKFSSQGISNY